jgi:CheY-like chemotaxis protein
MDNIFKKIYALVIDDDDDDLFLFVRSLKETDGFSNIKTFNDGCDALAFLRSEDGEYPDVIITDLKMPLVTGFDVIRTVRETEALAQIPVIAFSTSSFIVDIDKTQALGASGYITKPYNMDDYKSIAANIISFVRGSANVRNDNPAIRWFG